MMYDIYRFIYGACKSIVCTPDYQLNLSNTSTYNFTTSTHLYNYKFQDIPFHALEAKLLDKW